MTCVHDIHLTYFTFSPRSKIFMATRAPVVQLSHSQTLPKAPMPSFSTVLHWLCPVHMHGIINASLGHELVAESLAIEVLACLQWGPAVRH